MWGKLFPVAHMLGLAKHGHGFTLQASSSRNPGRWTSLNRFQRPSSMTQLFQKSKGFTTLRYADLFKMIFIRIFLLTAARGCWHVATELAPRSLAAQTWSTVSSWFHLGSLEQSKAPRMREIKLSCLVNMLICWICYCYFWCRHSGFSNTLVGWHKDCIWSIVLLC